MPSFVFMENKRPTLSDPVEYAIIKNIYFEKDLPRDQIDQIERLERMESRNKNLKNNSR